MRTLQKRAAEGPLIPQSVGGMVRFLTFPWNIRGFRYGIHDTASESGETVTDEGRKLIEWFHKQINHDPRKLLTIPEAAELLERSKPFWFSAGQE